ncbi:triose-phosphate isomerase [Sulfidibacter corallicola]|uniref:Triosephosphate isomerase n=1 Tax=Sulfidibacter corallicola TaxID=2818388 RepID=A0A8A4TEC4_SULCO|nr:triose-phosphate isomerase [Sulfidibacter corallicola]QTD47582.1 triose-phosphate isomerase [Sulfidibacter corallicola]
MAKYMVLGNWKSNGSREAAATFAAAFSGVSKAPPEGTIYGLALPFHLIDADRFGKTWVGGQNVSRFGEGAYTGETSAGMLAELGCRFNLVGHSERRQLFGETVADTREKIDRLLAADILPVLCIGETLEERKAGRLLEILHGQLAAIAHLSSSTELAIAYEPVWAIGTGIAAEPEDVADAHTRIKAHLAGLGFTQTPVLYGGSVKPANAAALATLKNVDGFLVGGASLKASDFDAIRSAFVSGKDS